MISTSRWTASPWHFVTWPLVRLRSWGTQPSSPGCCTSCTRGTCAPARGTARSRSRCSRCTGSTPALTRQRSFAVQLQQSAPRTGSELVKQRAIAVERCNGTTNEWAVGFLPCASGRCQASAWPRPPRRASAMWPTCRRRTSSTLGMRSCQRPNRAETVRSLRLKEDVVRWHRFSAPKRTVYAY